MAESKHELTLILGHTPANNFDGYDPHRHLELINMPVAEYIKEIVGYEGRVFPSAKHKNLIMTPWQLDWTRNTVKVVGYNFLEQVEPRHAGFYAFGPKGEIHDGIDIDYRLPDDKPGEFVRTVKSGYINSNGYNASADVYRVYVSEILEFWQTEEGYKAIDLLAKAGKLKDPEKWKKTLDLPMPQYLLWIMLSRIL